MAADSSASSPPTGGAFVYYPYTSPPVAGAGPGQWGTPVIVDGEGNPLPCPPPYTVETDPVTGKPTVILLAGDTMAYTIDPATGKPPTLPTYTTPTEGLSVYYYYGTPDVAGKGQGPWDGLGLPVIVDAAGNLVRCPPPFTVETDPVTGKPTVILLDGDTLAYTIDPATGKPPTLPTYTAPTEGAFAYYPCTVQEGGAVQWGTPRIVDAEGKSLWPEPPYTVETDPVTGKPTVILLAGDTMAYTIDPATGKPPTLPTYTAPTEGLSVYYPYTSPPVAGAGPGQWGTPVIVDGEGNVVASPPPYAVETDPVTGKPTVILLAGDTMAYTIDPATGKPPTLPTYTAPTEGLFVYYEYYSPAVAAAGGGQWLEPVIVDAEGNVVASPPFTVETDPVTGKPTVILLDCDTLAYTIDPATGKPPTLPTYTAPTEGVFVYYPYTPPDVAGAGPGQWGTPVIVDADGNYLWPHPPYAVETDPVTGKPTVILLAGDTMAYTIDPATGKPPTLPTYTPPGAPVPLEPPAGEDEEEEEEVPPGDVPEAGTSEAAGAAEEAPGPESPLPGPVEAAGVIGLAAEEIAAAAGPIPEQVEVVSMAGLAAEEVAAIPGSLPGPVEAEARMVDVVGAMPNPIPEPLQTEGRVAGLAGLAAEEVAAIPGSPPGPVEAEARMVDVVGALPNPIPEPLQTEGRVAGLAGLAAEEVAAIPGSPPGPVEAEARMVDVVGYALPDPIPEPLQTEGRVAGLAGLAAEEVAAIPGSPPGPVEAEARMVDVVGYALPDPIPEPLQTEGRVAGLAGLAAEDIAVLPGPMPEPFETEELTGQ